MTMRTVFVAALVFAVSCGSGTAGPDGGLSGTGGTWGGGNGSGVPASTTVASLNATQAAAVCDWVNAQLGGYGREVTCTDGSNGGTDPDQQTCAGGLMIVGPLCPTLTVGSVEGCAAALGTNTCAQATTPACAAFNACLASLGS
jgi:hypothetical protein